MRTFNPVGVLGLGLFGSFPSPQLAMPSTIAAMAKKEKSFLIIVLNFDLRRQRYKKLRHTQTLAYFLWKNARALAYVQFLL